MQIKSLPNLLWIIPFLSFTLGYQLLNQIYVVDKIATPNLVGKQLTEAIKITSANNLNLRIISEQIDHDLPENTIISQKPGHQAIKPNQAIFVVISTKAKSQTAPNLCGEPEEAIKKDYENLKIKSYHLPNIAPQKICIAQSPTAGQTLQEQKMIAYFSAGSSPWVLMPKLLGLQFSEVKTFLTTYRLKFNVQFLPDKYSVEHTIIDQKPAAGTLINLDKLTQIELCVSSKN